MILNENYSESTLITYKLKADKVFSQSQVPAGIALEIINTAKDRRLTKDGNNEWISVNAREYFPLAPFELEEGEEINASRRRRRWTHHKKTEESTAEE